MQSFYVISQFLLYRLDFFFTPTKHSAETPGKKLSSFKKRLFFEEEEEQSSQELHLPTLHKAKRTFSESTIVEKRALGNFTKKLLLLPKNLIF